jgi:hypothetical protein
VKDLSRQVYDGRQRVKVRRVESARSMTRRFRAKGSITRRHFLNTAPLVTAASASLFTVGLSASPDHRGDKNKRIVKAHLGKEILYTNSKGDTWTATWADDNSLYASSDDTFGFNRVCDSNLGVHRIMGGPPPNIQGVTINPMNEFGKRGELKSDDASWKACGLICVDGVLYFSVSRHWWPYWNESSGTPGIIQETRDASIIKSTDHGRTWSPAPELGHAMFPGHVFSTPFFVQYSKDGKGQKMLSGGNPSLHEMSGVIYDMFVYAVSNNGAWNNGNWMTLGRVSRGLIGRLNPQDWEFVQGFDAQGRPAWGPRYDTARYIFWAPGRASMTGIHYISGLDLYVMPQWYYPVLDNPQRRFKVTRWEFYQAPDPWGPWTLFLTQEFEPQGWYNLCIPSKFISEDGLRFWIFTSGNFENPEYNNLHYNPCSTGSRGLTCFHQG